MLGAIIIYLAIGFVIEVKTTGIVDAAFVICD